MKKLIFLTLALVVCILLPLRAQEMPQASPIALMAKEQIERRVKLPATACMIDSSWIHSANLDKMVMKFRIKQNGRADIKSLDFLNSSVEPINGLFVAALRRVKIPTEMIPNDATVVVDIQLKFDFMHTYDYRYETRYTVERVGPNNRPKEDFYQDQMGKIPGKDGSYAQKRFDADQVLYYNKYKVKGSNDARGLPQFRVTIMKSN